MNTETGFLLDNKYAVQAELGRGGMGIVYRGFDTVLRRPVAIKALAPHLSQDPEAVARFRQEAVAAANLQHTNIVTIHAVGEDNGWHYIVMQLLEGQPLDKWLAGRGPLSLVQVQHILHQLAAALDYAHKRQVVHRDVKPANVMLAANGHATLMDFGLVRALQRGDESSAGGDAPSTGGGTPNYMAPEQILGQPVDGRADIYALGVILYEMVTGQVPFVRETTLATAYAHLTDSPRPPRQLRADLPAPAAAVMLKALAKKPDDRYAHAGDLAAAFALARKGKWPAGLKPTPAPPAKKRTPTPPPTKKRTPTPPPARKPTPAPQPTRSPLPWLALLLVLLVVVIGGLAWMTALQSEPTPTPLPTVVADGAPATLDTPTPATNTVKTAPAAIVSPTTPPTAPAVATNTLAPTPTPSPTRSATATPIAVSPTPTAPLAPATPVLLAPIEGLQVSGDTTFVWAYTGDLATDWAFEVHLWQDGTRDHLTAAGADTQRAGAGRWQQIISVSQTTAVRAGGPGAYWWTVAVVQLNPYKPLGEEAPPRRLTVK